MQGRFTVDMSALSALSACLRVRLVVAEQLVFCPLELFG